MEEELFSVTKSSECNFAADENVKVLGVSFPVIIHCVCLEVILMDKKFVVVVCPMSGILLLLCDNMVMMFVHHSANCFGRN